MSWLVCDMLYLSCPLCTEVLLILPNLIERNTNILLVETHHLLPPTHTLLSTSRWLHIWSLFIILTASQKCVATCTFAVEPSRDALWKMKTAVSFHLYTIIFVMDASKLVPWFHNSTCESNETIHAHVEVSFRQVAGRTELPSTAVWDNSNI